MPMPSGAVKLIHSSVAIRMLPKQMFLALLCVCGFAGVFYYTLLQIGRFTLPQKTYGPVVSLTTRILSLSSSQRQLEIRRKSEAIHVVRVESHRLKFTSVPTRGETTPVVDNSVENLDSFTISRPSIEKLRKFPTDDKLDEKFIRNDERSVERIVEGIEGAAELARRGKDDVFRKSGQLKKRFPGVIIIGVKKGGTRALLEMLKLHPQVCACGPEMHFFDRYHSKGLAWYRDKMPLCYGNELSVEKTPSYFVTNGVASDMFNYSKSLNLTLRLLVIVRDPTRRAISDYTQNLHKSPMKRSPRKLFSTFEDLALRESSNGSVEVNLRWGAIKIGVYSKHLKRWYNYFKPEQIHVVSGEALIKEPFDETRKVERFLGLPSFIRRDHFVYNETKGFYCFDRSLSYRNNAADNASLPLRCLGTSKGRSHAKVSKATEKLLRDFYRPHNEELYRMVGRDFGWP